MKLYGTPPTRVRRAIWLLNELGLEYEHCPVDLMQGEAQRPAFLDLNPAAKVPVLVDGDVVLTESAAIQLYLAEKHPEAGLIPEALRSEEHTSELQPLMRSSYAVFCLKKKKNTS